MKCAIIFGGGDSSNSENSENIFTLQNKIVRIVVGTNVGLSCRSLFKRLVILLVPCQ
jgi:hypothetical protein